MTIYGADYYGAPSSLYGEAANLSFDASPFISRSWAPALVELRWTSPGGNWSELRLVRSNKGFPAHEDDGATLFDVSCGPRGTSPDPSFTYWADTPVTSDRWYQYALFVFSLDVNDWVNVGDTDVLVVNDHHNSEHMQNLLPTVFTTSPRWAGGGQADTNSPMSRFLSLFGFQADTVRTVYESLLHLHDPEFVPTRVLQLLCSELGVPFEPQIGTSHTRVLLNNAMHIHKTKGTRLGVEAFVTSLTGWASELFQGYNLMLDYNDSSAEEAIGNWAPFTRCTLTRALPATVVPYSTGTNLTNGCFQLTSTAIGVCEAHCGNALTHGAIASGIPVTANLPYTVSAYVQAAVTGVTNAVGIVWFDQNANFISTSVGGNVTSTTAAWTPVTCTATSPVGAQFAAVFIRVTATANTQVHYFDAFQLEQATSASAFQEARQLQILIGADRVNEVANPSFETDTTGWVVTATSTAAAATSVVTSVDAATPVTGTNAGSVTAPGSVINEGATFTLPNLLPVQDYTISAYVKAVSGSPVVLRAQDIGNALAIVQTTPVAVGAGWTRLSVDLSTGPLSPNVLLSVTTDASTPAASVFEIDGVLAERGITLRDYFDGTTSGLHPSDHIWGGTPNLSVSFLYRDYVTKLLRLTELLPDYLWPGMTFNFVAGQELILFAGDSGVYGGGFYGEGIYP